MDQRMIDGAQHTFATKYLRKPSVPVFGGSSSSVLNVVNVENSDNSDTGSVKRNVAKETPTKAQRIHRQQVITGDPRGQIILVINRQPLKLLDLQREIKALHLTLGEHRKPCRKRHQEGNRLVSRRSMQ